MKPVVIGALLVVVAVATSSDAREPTVSDYAICNREAARAIAPSESRPPAGTPGSADAKEAQVGPSAGPGYRTEAGRTDPTGALIARPDDPLLRGMAADHADDEEYRAAYRTCMAARGVLPQAAPRP